MLSFVHLSFFKSTQMASAQRDSLKITCYLLLSIELSKEEILCEGSLHQEVTERIMADLGELEVTIKELLK